MAKLLTVDGKERVVSPANASRGFTLDEVYELLDCDLVQVVELGDGQAMIIDEEGKVYGRKGPNPAATKLAQPYLMPGDEIVGHALVVGAGEFN
jgi:hypothetical protein